MSTSSLDTQQHYWRRDSAWPMLCKRPDDDDNDDVQWFNVHLKADWKPAEPSTQMCPYKTSFIASKHLKPLFAFGDPSNRAAKYSCQIFNRCRFTFLTVYQLSYTLELLIVPGRPLPAFRLVEFVLSVLRRRSFTELTAHFCLKILYNYVSCLMFYGPSSLI